MADWPCTIIQEDINAYAEVSADFNPIHIDPEFARTTPYGTTIAHGCIVGAVVTRHLVENMGFAGRVKSVKLKFVAPVRSGDSLHCGAEPGNGAGVEDYKVSCFNQRNETVAVGSASISQEAMS